VTALWRNLGAILPAWICQKPICMRRANVLEIKAATCQVSSLHLYQAVKLFHLPSSREIKGPPGEGAPEPRPGWSSLSWSFRRERERERERRARGGRRRPGPGSATWRRLCLAGARRERILAH
jgi:hypothetical protein